MKKLVSVVERLSSRRKSFHKQSFLRARNLLLRFGYDLRKTNLQNLVGSGSFFTDGSKGSLTASSSSVAIVLLVVGAETLPLLKNFLTTLRRAGNNRRAIVYTFNGLRSEVEDVATELFADVRLIPGRVDSMVKQYSDFGSAQFNAITNLKWSCLIDAFEADVDVAIFSDIDIAVIRDFEQFIVSAAGLYPCGFQSEARNTFPPQFCTGFMFFTRQAIPLLRFLDAASAANSKKGNDQAVLNEVARSNPSLYRDVLSLPEAVFMNGMQFPALAGPRHPDQVHTVEPLLFHANYVSGIEGKVRILKDLGFWSDELGSKSIQT